MNKHFKSPKLILLIITLSLMSILIAGCGDDKYVQSVKNGTMYMAPNVPVGKAFDQFFKNGKWKSLNFPCLSIPKIPQLSISISVFGNILTAICPP